MSDDDDDDDDDDIKKQKCNKEMRYGSSGMKWKTMKEMGKRLANYVDAPPAYDNTSFEKPSLPFSII